VHIGGEANSLTEEAVAKATSAHEKRRDEISKKFPAEETYGLKSQIRRAAVSIPSNIAEGAARNGYKEFLQYLNISRGSLSEVETQLLIAKNLGYIENPDHILEQIDKVFGLLGGLINSLRKNS